MTWRSLTSIITKFIQSKRPLLTKVSQTLQPPLRRRKKLQPKQQRKQQQRRQPPLQLLRRNPLQAVRRHRQPAMRRRDPRRLQTFWRQTPGRTSLKSQIGNLKSKTLGQGGGIGRHARLRFRNRRFQNVLFRFKANAASLLS